ncbi:unnamed protein product [Protopolystoma xenopodis]|uniref:Uncharacterized protein n=1 Tax=Protopolystoma xenopodis TaxID=117903 RepID=A0A3S5BD61_9PLAT|nr:unnamed protein product [Protopolystoma xenopodis]
MFNFPSIGRSFRATQLTEMRRKDGLICEKHQKREDQGGCGHRPSKKPDEREIAATISRTA